MPTGTVDTWVMVETKALESEFWRKEQELLYRILMPLILGAALDAAESSLDDLLEIGIGVDWGLVNQAALKWAQSYSYELVSGITDTSQRYVSDALAGWVQSGAPLDDLITQLEPMFGAVRAEMIGVTEATRSFASGNQIAWKESGVVDGQRWMTGEDELVCPVCSGFNGEVYSLDDSEHTPPAHVNCRCYIQPVVN
jgi:SPP1 gp7 family putative phage head morphogenesis protein